MVELSNSKAVVHSLKPAIFMSVISDELCLCGVFLITYAVYLPLRIVCLHGRGETIKDVNQPLEIDHAESGAAGGDTSEAIERSHIRHADRNGRQGAVRRSVNHTILPPVWVPADDIERLAPEGMEGVGDRHCKPGSCHTGCS